MTWPESASVPSQKLDQKLDWSKKVNPDDVKITRMVYTEYGDDFEYRGELRFTFQTTEMNGKVITSYTIHKYIGCRWGGMAEDDVKAYREMISNNPKIVWKTVDNARDVYRILVSKFDFEEMRNEDGETV